MGLHETDAEHGHDLELLPRRHLQFGKRRQGKAQDNQVESNFDAAANEAELIHVDDAGSFHLALPAVPKVVDGPALENHDE